MVESEDPNKAHGTKGTTGAIASFELSRKEQLIGQEVTSMHHLETRKHMRTGLIILHEIIVSYRLEPQQVSLCFIHKVPIVTTD